MRYSVSIHCLLGKEAGQSILRLTPMRLLEAPMFLLYRVLPVFRLLRPVQLHSMYVVPLVAKPTATPQAVKSVPFPRVHNVVASC